VDHPARDVAVVVTCYNLGRTVEEAVDSVLAQTRPASEIVVVDDGSKDPETREVLTGLRRPRTRVLMTEHAGVAAARSRGVDACQAPYLVFLDADDVFARDYVAKAAARLDADESLAFVSCAVQAFEGATYRWKPRACTALETLTHGSVHVSSMMRRTMWNAVGGFDAALPAYEDQEFFLRAIRAGFRGEIIDEPLLFYRVRPDSRYRAGIEPAAYRAAMAAIIEKHRDFVEASGVDVLLSKEAFLVELVEYQHGLLRQRDKLARELAGIQTGVDNARRALAELGRDANEPAPAIIRARPDRIRGGLILAYHRVASLSPDTHGLCVPADRFRDHMRYLAAHCTPMPLEDLFLAAQSDALPERAVAVTLDDGYLDALTTAAPILAEHRVPATLFVNSERLDEEHEAWHDVVERVLISGEGLPPSLKMRLSGSEVSLDVTTPDERRRALMTLHGTLLSMSADERADVLDQLAAWSSLDLTPRQDRRMLLGTEVQSLSQIPGCSIGSHSARHLLLPGQPPEVQRAELLECKRILEGLVEQPVRSFCYPFGEHDDELAGVVRRAGCLLAVTVDHGLVTRTTDPMLLPRHEIASCTLEDLAATIERTFGAGDTLMGGRDSIPGLPAA
jgi:peptidoglycan/xylan/chitin deacetylase (PgdA/CDA1 family)/glycosyltransferase involved in cell wall biosynthesis